MLPNFLIIGAQKSGTSSLAYYLREHKDIFMPGRELHFFDNRNGQFIRSREAYEQFFDEWSGERSVGECTPCYMYDHLAHKRISKVLSSPLLIAILRDPVDRAYSHYWKNVKNGREDLSFADAISVEEKRIQKSKWHRIQFSYVSRGFYYNQLERFRSEFGRDRLKIVFFRDLVESPEKLVRRLWHELGVDSEAECKRAGTVKNPSAISRSTTLFKLAKGELNIPDWARKAAKATGVERVVKLINERFNVVEWDYPEMSNEVRSHLRGVYAEDHRKLEELVSRQLPWVRGTDQ